MKYRALIPACRYLMLLPRTTSLISHWLRAVCLPAWWADLLDWRCFWPPSEFTACLLFWLANDSGGLGFEWPCARRDDILGMFLRKGVALAAVGMVAGVVVSALTASMMASLLYGVRPHDPAVFLMVPLVLFVIAALASYLPARRATKVNPMIAFRES